MLTDSTEYAKKKKQQQKRVFQVSNGKHMR